MPSGQSQVTKVHYKGQEDDFIVFVESEADVGKWKGDRSVPLAQVVNSFKVFVSHKQGVQGELDEASKSTLENEFGSKYEEDAIIKILEQGSIQTAKSTSSHPGRGGERNETQGARQAH